MQITKHAIAKKTRKAGHHNGRAPAILSAFLRFRLALLDLMEETLIALPSEPSESSLIALVDSREQTPLDLSPLKVERATLVTGDYSLKGLETIVAIERKSLPDLVGCVGRDRERFEKEIQRLLAYPVRCLVVEADWSDVERRNWAAASRIEPKHVKGSLLGWQASGLPVLMAGDHSRAGELVSRMLYIAARRRWKEAKGLIQSFINTEGR